MLNKIYKDENKLSSMSDNFNFKVIIFHNKYRQVKLLTDACIYDVSIMLSGKAQTHYYANRGDTFIFG